MTTTRTIVIFFKKKKQQLWFRDFCFYFWKN